MCPRSKIKCLYKAKQPLHRGGEITSPPAVPIVAGVMDDNLGKAVLDLLTAYEVIEDDAKVVSITSRWDAAVAPGRLLVAVAGA